MPRYSLEVAHVYGDQEFSREQQIGLEYARWFIENVGEENVSVCVMVDDVHAPLELDIEKYVARVQLEGVIVDHVFLESQCISGAIELVSDPDMRSEIQKFDGGERVQRGFTVDGQWVAMLNGSKPTCAAMSAAFSLIRLGGSITPHIKVSGRPFRNCQEVVNILPQRFMRAEANALAIIAASKWDAHVGLINHIFHPENY